MTKPAAGEVFRYPFLWKREQLAGQTEGRKTRPVCIAVTVAKSDSETAVFILPITTQPPLASRKSVVRGLPVVLGGDIKGAINDHSASVISLAYLPPFRSCLRRVSSVQAIGVSVQLHNRTESQPAGLTQLLLNRALKERRAPCHNQRPSILPYDLLKHNTNYPDPDASRLSQARETAPARAARLYKQGSVQAKRTSYLCSGPLHYISVRFHHRKTAAVTNRHALLRTRFQKFLQREDGAVAVIFALLILFVFVPILGVSTELGLRTMEQRKLQHQADVAAYSAIVALRPNNLSNNPDPGCPPQVARQGGYLAAWRSGYAPLNGRTPTELSCALNEIVIIDANTAGVCGLQAADLGEDLFLCVRLTLDQDRLFSRIFSLFTDQDADQSVRLSARAVAQFPTEGGGVPPCIRTRGNIGTGNNNNVVAPDCLFASSQGTISVPGSSSNVGLCLATPVPTSSACRSSGSINTSNELFAVPRGLEWVTRTPWTPPSYCKPILPGNNVPLTDGQIYCTNSPNDFNRSGAGSALNGKLLPNGTLDPNGKGNLIILGPDAGMTFAGNAGFNFNALTWDELPPSLRGPGPTPQGPGAEGILIYAPDSNVTLGGNSSTLATGDACSGIISNTFSMSGAASIRIGCDRNRVGNPQGDPPKPISLAF